MAPAKPLSRKRLNLGEDEEDDDEQDTAASVTGSGLAASTSFKLQKTAKKRVNPFKTASASAKPRVSSLLPPQPPPPPPSLPPPAAQAKKSASTQSPESTPTNTNEGEEEDDYLSMSLTTLPPASTSPETYTQRRLRLARESEARARAPSKTELAQQEKQRREEGLARSLLEDQNSKGYRMMKAMGWKGEGGLGKATHHQPPLKQPVAQGGEEEDGYGEGDDSPKAGNGLGLGYSGGAAVASDIISQQHQLPRGPILEPIALSIKEDRAGIGHLTSEKLKFRESLHCSGISPTTHPTPPPHESAESYRTRLRLDKQEKRAEAQFYSAQTILEGFDRGENQASPPDQPTPSREFFVFGSRYPSNTSKDTTAAPRTVPLKSIPLLYRSLILHRESKDRQKRARYEFIESLSSATHSTSKPLNLPGYERDFEDKIVFGATQMVEDDGDLEEEDEELEEFNQLPFTERLDMIVNELRGKWKYCFWCKYQYASQGEMDESCPGLEEDSHG